MFAALPNIDIRAAPANVTICEMTKTNMNKKWYWLSGFLGLLICATVGGSVWLYSQFQPANSAAESKVTVVVKRGDSIATIANQLQQKGVIKNSLLFKLYARVQKLDTKIQAGSYKLDPRATMPTVALSLTQGTEDSWVTFLEGWRREEIAEYLAAQDALTEFEPVRFLEISAMSEGMLFPDTYLVPNEITAEDMYALLIRTFEKKFVQAYEKEIENSGKSLAELVTFASLIQREAQNFEDMRRVAGILENRIQIEMPLQVDATLQYVRGYDSEKKSWWTPPLIEYKKSSSPFNTYLVLGLPPRAIANPGLDALRAALDPQPTDDVFYIHAPSGTMYYAKTLEEHNQNVARYLR